MWFMNGGMGPWMWFGGVLMVVFWGVVIALIVWAVTRLTGRGGSTTKPTPLDVAKERYAKGEIGREEFEQIKKDL